VLGVFDWFYPEIRRAEMVELQLPFQLYPFEYSSWQTFFSTFSLSFTQNLSAKGWVQKLAVVIARLI